MTLRNYRNRFIGSIVICGAALSGCASMVISDETLIHKTAFGLGLNDSDITIINRENDGFVTRYTVQSKAGKKYSCTAGGTIGTVGEPGCEEVGPSVNTCNALLKAAGKC